MKKRNLVATIVASSVIIVLAVLVLYIRMFYHSRPPQQVPEALYGAFTEEGKIPVDYYYYRDDSYPPSKPRVYSIAKVNENLNKISHGEHNSSYGVTDAYLYEALEKYAPYFKGKRVAIIGSTSPWYESVALYYGGKPVTIEYNTIKSYDPRIETMTVAEYEKNPEKFDAMISVSSYEHDGLGRYGDPINPNGDLEAMKKAKNMLNDGGILFLAVPVGRDRLCWNVHRIYGALRLPQLLDGWDIIDSFGYSPTDFEQDDQGGGHQPVFVLKPSGEGHHEDDERLEKTDSNVISQ